MNFFVSNIADLGEMEDKWKTIKGDFLNVSLFSLPSRLDMAPRGASMYTHLADGSLDLVFCGDTDRKEFVRFLRRHGNAKCQVSYGVPNPFSVGIQFLHLNLMLKITKDP